MADILVVVDHPTIGLDLWDILQDDGHEVRHVTCSEAALAALYRHKPDLIVTGHAMPSLDGRTFVDTLEDDARWSDIPLIQVGNAAVAQPRGAAVAGFIRKTWSQVALLNVVSRLTSVGDDVDRCVAG